MTLATSTTRGKTPMNESFVLADVSAGEIFSNSPMQNVGKTRAISFKMNESLFIVEYNGSVPLNVPDDWPLPSYEVRRKLPMRECEACKSDIFHEGRGHRARRTSWIVRKKGEFFWLRVCFEHMKPEVRAVIKEMYSR